MGSLFTTIPPLISYLLPLVSSAVCPSSPRILMPMVTSRRGNASPPLERRGRTHSLGHAVDPSTPKESLLQEGLPQREAVSGVWAFQTLVKGGLPGAPDPSQEPGIAAQLLGPFNVIGPEGTNSWQQVERVVHLGGTGCRVKSGRRGGICEGSGHPTGNLLNVKKSFQFPHDSDFHFAANH